jgi:hypothetical protein
MNCTNEPWTNRLCHFSNLTFRSGQYWLLSPYPIDFEENLLCLGSKTPPVDFEPNRLVGVFQTIEKTDRQIRRIVVPSHLVSIYYNFAQLWHQNFDFIFPLFLTMSLDGQFDPHRMIFLPEPYFDAIPKLAGALSDFPIVPAKQPLLWDDVTFGMVKLTDLSQSLTDPPYKFPQNCTSALRSRVLHHHNISESQKETLVFLRRRGTNRQITNADELADLLRSLRPDLEFADVYFEGGDPIDQVNLISRARVFVSIHGSGLANLLWMPLSAALIEIVPPFFTHQNWFEIAARASGLRFYRFEADSVPGTIDSETVSHCKKHPEERRRQPCHDALRDQNVHVGLSRFEAEVGPCLTRFHGVGEDY